MRTFKRKKVLGFTTVELVITLAIISALVAVAVMSIFGIMPTYKLSRGVRLIFNTALSARSKAVSLNKTFRFNCIDNRNFKLEWYDDENTTWVQDGPVKTLPTDIEISQDPVDYVDNCETNLEFTSRGIINILNGKQTDPFLAVKNIYSNEEKSVTVNIGGNIKINR